MNYTIVAIKVDARESIAPKVQEILTNFGCNIKVRLGLHDLPEGACSPAGLIILELKCSDSEAQSFIDELNGLEAVSAKMIQL